MMVAGVAFFGALLGIGSLLLLKRWENTHGRTLFSQSRQSADRYALALKAFLFNSFKNVRVLTPFFLHILQRVVRASAITFGHLAHWLGRRSHELADFVSHKYRFERRETRSEFLKKVIEHPMKSVVRNAPSPTREPLEEPREISSAVIPEPLVELRDIQNSASPIENRVSIARVARIPSFVGKTLVGATQKIRKKRKVPKITKGETVPVVITEP